MLDLLRFFGQVMEEQSFTVVAQKLGFCQPAVSNQMRALKESSEFWLNQKSEIGGRRPEEKHI